MLIISPSSVVLGLTAAMHEVALFSINMPVWIVSVMLQTAGVKDDMKDIATLRENLRRQLIEVRHAQAENQPDLALQQ